MSKKKNRDSAMYGMFGVNSENSAEEVAAEAKAVAPVGSVSASGSRTSVTYLATNSVMEGKLQTDGDVEVAGNFNGDIIAKGNVILHSNMQGNVTACSLQLLGCSLTGNVVVEGQVNMDNSASVTGNVTAGELICSGKIKGDLGIKGNVALNESSVVEGNIVTGTMTMSKGATITGSVKMGFSK